jgi:ribosomal protein S20
MADQLAAEKIATPVGEKTLVLRVPVDLATWAGAQARREGTDLSKKIRGFLRQWQAEIVAAEEQAAAEATVRQQAEIEAAVQAALAAQVKARRVAARKPRGTRRGK